jgi:serine/threonine-protein kinase
MQRCLRKTLRERLHDIADARIEIEEVLASPAGAINAGPIAKGKAQRSSLTLPFAALAGLIVGSLATGLAYQRLRPQIAQPLPQVIHGLVGVAPADRLQSSTSDVSFGDQRPSQPAIALSPDGRLLAFSAVKGDRQQLYLRPIDQLEATPIADSEGDASPFFSPEGKWIRFWANGALRKDALRVQSGLLTAGA